MSSYIGALRTMSILILLVMLPGLLLAIPAIVVLVEVAASLMRHPDHALSSGRLKRVAIVVPAHNESVGVLPTLSDLKQQILPGDRIVLVADNCTDDTAAVASGTSVEVVVRTDPTLIGKGYALSAGMQWLAGDPPDFVMFCDADCRLEPLLIDRLWAACERSNRPVQACYLMKPAIQTPDQIFAEFAWVIKNLLRPQGLRNLGGPCQLMGTGMMFPWDLIRSAPIASGNLVEDLQLGLDLALRGAAPLFVPSAVTTSLFPVSAKGADTQRKRWVEGHLATIRNQLPQMLVGAIKRADLNLLALALDLLVPPMVLFIGLTMVVWCLTSVAVVAGVPVIALLPATTTIVTLIIALSIAWFAYGKTIANRPSLPTLAHVAWTKSQLYFELIRGKKAGSWIRTERPVSDAASEPGAVVANAAETPESDCRSINDTRPPAG